MSLQLSLETAVIIPIKSVFADGRPGAAQPSDTVRPGLSLGLFRRPTRSLRLSPARRRRAQRHWQAASSHSHHDLETQLEPLGQLSGFGIVSQGYQ